MYGVHTHTHTHTHRATEPDSSGNKSGIPAHGSFQTKSELSSNINHATEKKHPFPRFTLAMTCHKDVNSPVVPVHPRKSEPERRPVLRLTGFVTCAHQGRGG